MNGRIVTVDEGNSVTEAVAVRNGWIVKVGSTGEVEALVGPDTDVVDLEGRAVLPGFIDSHVHVLGAGRLKVMEREYVDIKYADSVVKVLEKIGERAKVTPEGQWIIGWGYMWTRFKEKRVPTAKELDEVSPDNPVLLVFSAYGAANSYALRLAGVTRDSKPEYGELELDPETGEPTGVLKGGAAVRLVRNHVPPLEITPYEASTLALGQFAKWGITTIHDAGTTRDGMIALQRLLREGGLTSRVRLYFNNIA
ncbi:MAG TPA: amidohydrolase family protein, partial [Patescibacteria group bacterium]|nr:amidohydrolase family protein [Patescibacteria group bacterium]